MAKFSVREKILLKKKQMEQGGTETDSPQDASNADEAPNSGDAEATGVGSLAHSEAVPNMNSQTSRKPGRNRNSFYVDIRDIKTEEQIRDKYVKNPKALSPESIKALADLIIEEDPDGEISQELILIQGDEGQADILYEGARRVLACTLNAERTGNDVHFVQPARYRKKGDVDRLFGQFMINNSKEEVDLEATVKFFDDIVRNEGMSQTDLAKRAGMSVSKVSKLLKISTYPEEIQRMIYARELGYEGNALRRALKAAKNIEAREQYVPSETSGETGALKPAPVGDEPQTVPGEAEVHESEPPEAGSPAAASGDSEVETPGSTSASDDEQPESPKKPAPGSNKSSKAKPKAPTKDLNKAVQKSRSISVDRGQMAEIALGLSRLNEAFGGGPALGDNPNNKQILDALKDALEQDILAVVLKTVRGDAEESSLDGD